MRTHSAAPATFGDRVLLIGAVAVLLAGLTENLGATWDVQWHVVVGPDTFFTAPHLMLYVGIAAGGIAALTVVLLTTFAGPGRAARNGRTVTVFGTFAAPVGFLVVGLGAAGQLVYGLSDLWWHEVYGFDATLSSPPHVAMSLCSMTSAVGTIVVFAGLRRTVLGRVGLAVAAANVVSGMSTLALALLPFLGGGGFALAVATVATMGPILVGGVLRAPGWVVVHGVAYVALLAGMSAFAPWATAWYAASVGLPMREYADNSLVQVVLVAPWSVPLVAVLVALGWWGARALGLGPRWVVPVLGAVLTPAALAAYGPQLGESWFGLLPTLAAVPVGAAAAWVAWRWAAGLRRLDVPAARPAPAAGDLAVQGA